METRMLLKDESLWNRIQGFSLDAPDADFPFSKKAGKRRKLESRFYAKSHRRIQKICLSLLYSSQRASPSKIVDKVWHMHLIYTQNYWEEFCPAILKGLYITILLKEVPMKIINISIGLQIR
jgi:hypothetical protein